MTVPDQPLAGHKGSCAKVLHATITGDTDGTCDCGRCIVRLNYQIGQAHVSAGCDCGKDSWTYTTKTYKERRC